jgi:hypothetical protein
MVELLEKYHNNPSRLSTSDYYLAKRIDEFIETNGLKLGKDITPAINSYDEVQRNVANETVIREEQNIRREDEQRRRDAYKTSGPSLREGTKAAGISAVIEGGVTFCLSVAKKRKEKKFSEFTIEDWKEIGIDSGKGTAKGGIRGGAIYALTN